MTPSSSTVPTNCSSLDFWNFTVLIIVNVEHFKCYGRHFQRQGTENTIPVSLFVGEKTVQKNGKL
jgi:hypothetical protein